MVFGTPVPLDGYECRNENDPALEPIRAVQWFPEGRWVGVLLYTDPTARQGDVLRMHGELVESRVTHILDTYAGRGFRWLCPAGGDSYPVDETTERPEPGESPRVGTPASAMLSTVWLLMGQRGLATVRTGVPAPKNKAARKRLRAVQHELNRLRIIELRAGSEHAAAYMGTTRAYRHRWMVAGHWRRQWFPVAGGAPAGGDRAVPEGTRGCAVADRGEGSHQERPVTYRPRESRHTGRSTRADHPPRTPTAVF
jgi:hypothetical protein